MQLCCGVFLGVHHTLNPEGSNNNTTGQEAITPTTTQPNELCYFFSLIVKTRTVMTLWVCHTVRYNRVLAWFPIRCLKHYTHIHTLGYERHVVRDTCFRSQEQTVNHICIFSFSHDKSCKHTYTTCDTQVTEVADSQKTCRSRSNGGNCGIISKKICWLINRTV